MTLAIHHRSLHWKPLPVLLLFGFLLTFNLSACGSTSQVSVSSTQPPTPSPQLDDSKLILIGEYQVQSYDFDTKRLTPLPFGNLYWPGVDLTTDRGISSEGWLAARVLGPNREQDQLSLQLVNVIDGSIRQPIPLLSDAFVDALAKDDHSLAAEDVTHMLLGGWAAPRWSPDGEKLVFMAAREGFSSDLYLYQLVDGSIQRLTFEPDQANAIGWSPDSNTIIYTVGFEFTPFTYLSHTLRSYNLLTGEDQTLLSTEVWPGGHIFGWHSNDEFLFGFYDIEHSSYRNVYLVNITTGETSILYDGFVADAAVEPYSGAYALLLDVDLGWGSGAYIGSLDTEELEDVVDWGGSQYWYGLDWIESEGRYAVASTFGSLLFDTDLTRLDAFPEEACPPSPSPDGSWILFGGCDGPSQDGQLRLYERWAATYRVISDEHIQKQLWRVNSSEVVYITWQGAVYRASIPDGENELVMSEGALDIALIQPLSARVAAQATQRAVPTRTPKPTSTPTATPTPGPTPTPEIPEMAPRLQPGDPLLFDEIYMMNSMVGWGITARATDYSLLRTYHLIRTEDGGTTWWEVTPPEMIKPSDLKHLVLQGFFLDAQRAWVMLRGGLRSMVVWRTTDGGESWRSSRINLRGQSSESWPSIFFTNQEQGWLLLSYFQGAGSYEEDILRSRDGGQTWESILLEDYEHGPIRDFSALNNNIAWITSGHGAGVTPAYRMHLTNDGGVTWEHIIPDPQDYSGPLQGDCVLHQPELESYLRGRVLRSCMTYEDPPYRYFFGYTEDGGRSWRYIELPGKPYSVGDSLGWAVKPVEDGGSIIYKTRDGGVSWFELTQVDWEGSLSFIDDAKGWANARGQLLISEDGGRTWSPMNASLNKAPTEPIDLTNIIYFPGDLSTIQSNNTQDINLIAAFNAQSPTSLTISDRILYAGLANGRIVRWPWKATSISPDSLPMLRISEDWIYDLEVYPEGMGFVAASKDGRAYGYRDLFYDFLNMIPPSGGEISGVAVLSNSILTGGEDSVVRQWGRVSGAGRSWQVFQSMVGHRGWVWDVDVSPAQDLFASCGADGSVRLWAAVDGTLRQVLQGHTSTVTKCRFSMDGRRLFSSSRDGTARVWDVDTGDQLFLLEGHQDWVLDIAASRDGSLLASVDAGGSVILWDAQSGAMLRQWKAHEGASRGVVFRPDGLMLFTVGDDNLVKLWGITP